MAPFAKSLPLSGRRSDSTSREKPWHDETRRQELVRFLLQKGADPNIVAGNGLTALDMADACGATRIGALLQQHGGKRTTESAKRSRHPDAGDAVPQKD